MWPRILARPIVAFLVGFVAAVVNLACSHGGGGSGTISRSTPPAREFLYVNNSDDGTITSFAVDQKTGQLRSLGMPTNTGGPGDMAVHPSGKFLYIATANETVSAFSIDRSRGTLTLVAGSPFNAGHLPGAIAVAPSGRFLYVTNAWSYTPGQRTGPTISVFAIDMATGALKQVPGSPFPSSGGPPRAMAIDPSGGFLYVANYSIDSEAAERLHGRPSGKGSPQGCISALAIDQSSGAVKELAGSPVMAGGGESDLVVDPSGKFVYKSNTEDDSVAAFAINSSGALIPIAGSPFAVSRPFGLALDPVGHFLFVSGWNPNWRSGAPKGSVSVFTVNSGTGGLTPATGSLLPVKSTPPSRVAVDPSGKFAYVTDSGSGGLMVFAIDESTGAFRQSGWFATGHRPQSVVIAGLDE